MLASTWADDGRPLSAGEGAYRDSTEKACIRHGWIVPTGESGQWSSARHWERYRVSHAGIMALAAFLQSAYAPKAAA